MPFINSKITVKLSEEQEKNVKNRLGQAIALIPGKSESWLMLGFEDGYNIYFKGNKEEKAAFVDVSIYGSASSTALNSLTVEICDIFKEELGIPKDKVYVKYTETKNWGWNGGNF